MARRLKKVKINKFWKNIFSNKPLIWIVVILLLAVVFGNKHISQYFQPESSQAAATQWDLKRVTSWGGRTIVTDVDDGWLAFKWVPTTTPSGTAAPLVYKLSSNLDDPTFIRWTNANESHVAVDGPRINNGNVVWAEAKWNGKNMDTLIFSYDIYYGQKVKAVTNDPGLKSGLDIYGQYISYYQYPVGDTTRPTELVVRNILGSDVRRIPRQGGNATEFVYSTFMENNRVFWIEKSISGSNYKTYMYNVGTKQIVPAPIPTDLNISWPDVNGNMIVAGIKNNIYALDYIKGVMQTVTTGTAVNQFPKVWDNLVTYIRAAGPTGTIQEVHLYNLSDKTDNPILSIDTAKDKVHLDFDNYIITKSAWKKAILAGSLFFDDKNSDLYVATQP